MMTTNSELQFLQALRLKGRVGPAELASTVDIDIAEVGSTIAALNLAGLLVEGKTLRLSPEGRARLVELLAAERSGIDMTAIAAAYNEFRAVNADFKEIVWGWQIKAGQPNTHEDAEYDAALLARLDGVHARAVPIIDACAAEIPRLHVYSRKLLRALERVKLGETTWFARPVIDSFHTVWFELHEELILATGLTREEEAKAGHAE